MTDEPIVVCGAGAAGIAASLTLARHGKPVLLVEERPQIGGTVAHALIHTLGGLYDADGEFLYEGLPTELAGILLSRGAATGRRRMGRVWVLSVRPPLYRDVIAGLIASDPRISLRTRACVSRAERDGERIAELVVTAPEGELRLSHPRAVVDATGSGEIARLTGHELHQSRGRSAAGGLISVLRNVRDGALAFPRGVAMVRSIREAATHGELPARCRFAWLDSGNRGDEVYVKLFVPLDPRDDSPAARERIYRRALDEQNSLVAFLKQQPEFREATIAITGCLGIRDGGQVVGEYTLTGDDVRRARRFSDAACKCVWPIEYWDPDEGVSLEYLPDHEYYEIPLRCLRVKGVTNLWAAGKNLSADAKAQASARVVGSCWAMGEAVAREITRL